MIVGVEGGTNLAILFARALYEVVKTHGLLGAGAGGLHGPQVLHLARCRRVLREKPSRSPSEDTRKTPL
jgi:hypothetical protein